MLTVAWLHGCLCLHCVPAEKRFHLVSRIEKFHPSIKIQPADVALKQHVHAVTHTLEDAEAVVGNCKIKDLGFKMAFKS